MTIEEIYTLFLNSTGICTDTRKIKKGNIYFALKGDNFNGNKFAKNAISNGAIAAIIDEKEHRKNDQYILVNEVLKTLQDVANFHRKKLALPIISLTGSNGKTTTKELINVVLSKKFKTVATKGNLNNHIGVPLTLLSLKEDTEIGIVEMGANHLKEIELLSSIAEPDFGYITNFGKAHLEGFGGVEGVIKGKSELYNFLENNNKKAFVNPEDKIQLKKTKNIDSIYLSKEVSLASVEPFVEISYKNSKIQTHLIGAYNFSNIKAAITIGEYFEVPFFDIKSALENYIPNNNRSQIIEKKGCKIILDAYNANPSSMELALENFAKIKSESKTIILGDMFELGETSTKEHQFISDLANTLDFKNIVLIGDNFAKIKSSKSTQCSTYEDFKIIFSTFPKSSYYLIKGSRGMALERIVDLFD